jgi:hypothetical protein
MSLIKQGQGLISEFIKTDIPTDELRQATIYALNSGKRLRAILAASLIGYDDMKQVVFVEYIHTGISILSDMVNNRETRRHQPSMHVRWGHAIASQVANRLIVRGLSFNSSNLNSHSHLTSTSTSHLTMLIIDKLIASLKYPDWPSLPQREVIVKIKLLYGTLFMLARPDIGELFGMCYSHMSSDIFAENMNKLMQIATKNKLWSPLLKDLVKYLMTKQENLKN